MRHENFAAQIIRLQQWFDLKANSFAVPFTKNTLLYLVRGRKRQQPLSFDEVAGPARPYIPVEEITLKRSKDEAIRLGKAFLAVCDEDVPLRGVPLWKRSAFRKGWEAAMQRVKGEAEWQNLREQHHENS